MKHQFRDLVTGERFIVEVRIFEADVAHELANRARKSKNKRATALNGAITVKYLGACDADGNLQQA